MEKINSLKNKYNKCNKFNKWVKRQVQVNLLQLEMVEAWKKNPIEIDNNDIIKKFMNVKSVLLKLYF